MKTEIIKFNFNGNQIDFEPTKKNVMVNATQMANAFNKRLDHFLRSDHAKEFISVLEFTPFGGNSEPLKPEEIIQTKGKSGTWMHRILALKFAAWLNPAFELWVYTTIEQLLFGELNNRKDKLSRKAEISKRKYELKEILENSEEYQELKNLESEEIKIGKELKSIDSSVVAEQLLLFNENQY
jgi:hypothetical protein